MPTSSEPVAGAPAGFADAAVTLPSDVDLHARPAAGFVRAALGFRARVTVSSAERTADAKSLLSILALGAKRGTTLRLRAEGDDAAAAVTALAATLAGLSE